MTAGRTNSEALSQHWCTPPKYVDAIREFFGGSIALDPCSNEYSIVQADTEYTLPDCNGLYDTWDFPTIFVNPPYGRDKNRNTSIKNWLHRCAQAYTQHGAEVLALVPVATNTRHWKDYVFAEAAAVAFLYDTRLRFMENGNCGGKGAPMSCAMIYWGNEYNRFESIFIRFGAVVRLSHLQGKLVGTHEHTQVATLDLGI